MLVGISIFVIPAPPHVIKHQLMANPLKVPKYFMDGTNMNIPVTCYISKHETGIIESRPNWEQSFYNKYFICTELFTQSESCTQGITMHFEIVDFNFTHREFEYFEYVYSNPFLNYSMVPLYVLGVVSCFGLKLVSWFEKSGQAGPHRTLVNRLMSLTLDQVSHICFFFL